MVSLKEIWTEDTKVCQLITKGSKHYMFDLFAFLFEQFHDLDNVPSQHYLLEKLNEAGFDDAYIDQALLFFNTLLTKINQHKQAKPLGHSHPYHRVFSRYEKNILSCEIRGYLSFLLQKQVLANQEIEILIAALSELDFAEVNLSVVKLMILIIAWVCHVDMPVLISDGYLFKGFTPNADTFDK